MRMKELYVLCFSIFPLMLCSGMVYSILSLYIVGLGATKTQIGLIFMVGSAAGAIFAPILGKMSDKIGRRPILIISMAGFLVAFFLYSMIGSFVYAFPIQALEGFTWAAMGVTVTAYIADITPEEKRGWAMGIYSRTWYMGWIAGPVLGGYMADTIGFQPTFVVGSMLVAFGFLLMLLYVKESKRQIKKDALIENIKQKLDQLDALPLEEVKQLMKQVDGVFESRMKALDSQHL